ncbi:MAG: hypothetical protein RLZZ580_647, partial [Cyanobacteriota bacterium]
LGVAAAAIARCLRMIFAALTRFEAWTTLDDP